MTWLKKYGLEILKIAGTVLGFVPMVQAVLPASPTVTTVTGDLIQIANVVTTAEGMIGAISDPNAKTGAQKLTAATPFVAQIIMSNLVAGKKIADQALFTKGCTEVTSGVADILNSLDAGTVNVTPTQKA